MAFSISYSLEVYVNKRDSGILSRLFMQVDLWESQFNKERINSQVQYTGQAQCRRQRAEQAQINSYIFAI